MKRLLQINIYLIFFLIVFGGTVRTFGAGLACPDWPLCHGKLIPPMDFQVLLEWGHRLTALIVSFITLAILVITFVKREYRSRFRAPITFIFLLLIFQAVMGGLTVLKLLHFSTVTMHLAMGQLFFMSIIWMYLRVCNASVSSFTGRRKVLISLVVAFLAVYAQAVLGAVVSSSHAGLACPDFPTCFGEWIPPLEGLIKLQFFHRVGALIATLLVLVAGILVLKSDAERKLKSGIVAALFILLCQICIGVANVLFAMPPALRIAHLAFATALIAMLWVSVIKVRYAVELPKSN